MNKEKHALLYRESMGGSYDIKLADGHCIVNAGIGKDYLTIYVIETEPEYRRQGEATRLLTEIKERCANTGRQLTLWCPMSDEIIRLCKKLNIPMQS